MDELGRFFSEQHARVYGYLVRLSGDATLAADVLQEACARYLARYSGERNAPLLYAIARNVFYDHVRRRGREVVAVETADCRDNQEQELVVREEYRAVMAALQQMEPRERELLALVAGGDLKYRDMARMLDMNETAVKVGVHRARRRLRKILEDGDGTGNHQCFS